MSAAVVSPYRENRRLNPKILRGWRLSLEEAEKITRQKIISRTCDWEPQGSRIMILPDVVPDKVGEIILPVAITDLEQMGWGWIVSVGPFAGLVSCGPIGNITVDVERGGTPEDLLGLHVLFGFHAGKALRFSIFDSEYKSQSAMYAPMDIWAVDFAEDPWTEEAAYARDFQMKYAKIEAAARREETEAQLRMAKARQQLVIDE